MKKIIASIDITSSVYSLAELSQIAGAVPGESSHDRGSARGASGTWDESILRIESRIPPDRPIHDHVDNLLQMFKEREIGARFDEQESAQFYLNVAIMFSTANVSVELSKSQMLEIGERGISLEIAAYPCQGDDDSYLGKSKGKSKGTGVNDVE